MGKRKQKKFVHSASSAGSNQARKSRRNGLRFALGAILTLSVVGVALAAFKQQYDIAHDLTVIGNGAPAVVQIHDPNCQLCQRLRRNAESAMRGLGDQLQYRIADIKTLPGRRLQQRHGVQHVTLLLFDSDGELRNVLSGVKDAETLRRAFRAHLESDSRKARG